MELRTNRDFYLFIVDLAQRNRASDRSLEMFLRALRSGASAHREEEALSLCSVATLLEEAFQVDPGLFDPAWLQAYTRELSSTGYERWERLICAQIVDLHEMELSGALRNDLRYFGIDAPRGSRWYNFDPPTFLECGAEGTFGGWQEGDTSGRQYVPGLVATLDASGQVVSVDPRTIEDSIYELEAISWDQFADFLGSGQWYE